MCGICMNPSTVTEFFTNNTLKIDSASVDTFLENVGTHTETLNKAADRLKDRVKGFIDE